MLFKKLEHVKNTFMAKPRSETLAIKQLKSALSPIRSDETDDMGEVHDDFNEGKSQR